MTKSSIRFSISALLQLTAAVAVLCSLWLMMPPFAKFVANYPRTVFGLSFLSSLISGTLATVCKQGFASSRIWHSILVSSIAGTAAGIWMAYAANQHYVPQPQWPGIGGAFIIWFVALFTASPVAAITAAFIPRANRSS